MKKELLLKQGYRRFKQPGDEPTLYQKKISDEKGIKYFINCYHYIFPNREDWCFKIQLNTKVGTYNVELLNPGDIGIMNIETLMEIEWGNHGAKYYEEFAIEVGDVK